MVQAGERTGNALRLPPFIAAAALRSLAAGTGVRRRHARATVPPHFGGECRTGGIMKAVGLYKYLPIDNPESLLDVEVPKPEPHGRDLLVRVRAVSVNPVDTKVRSPKDKTEAEPKILGWDAAGTVEAVGEEVSLFTPGDAVYYAGSLNRQGCDAEYHLVDERIVGHKPRS